MKDLQEIIKKIADVMCDVSNGDLLRGQHGSGEHGSGDSGRERRRGYALWTRVKAPDLLGAAPLGFGRRSGANGVQTRRRTPTAAAANPARSWSPRTPRSGRGWRRRRRSWALASFRAGSGGAAAEHGGVDGGLRAAREKERRR